MVTDPYVLSLLANRAYDVLSESSKTISIRIKSEERGATRRDIQTKLQNDKVVFEQKMVPGSSFESTMFTANKINYRFIYKPLKGGGSGGGAEQTKLAESAQAVYCAVAFGLGRDLKSTDEVIENYKAYSKFFDIDGDLKKILSELGEDWESSSIVGANAIRSYLPRKSYVFHRGSRLVNSINSKFAELNAKLISTDKFKNINKWSPADIWAVDVGFTTFDTDIKKINDLSSFNDYILRLMKERKMVGISLKKIETATAHATDYNVGTVIPQATFSKFQITAQSASKDVFASKDVYVSINYNNAEYRVQFRTFDIEKTWQGEIKSTSANLGKLSNGPLNIILSSTIGKTLTPADTIKSSARNRDVVLFKKMYALYNSLEPGKISEVDFVNRAKLPSTTVDWVLSKYLGLEIISLIKNSSKKNEICDRIIRTAMSSTKLSAPFVKIS